MPQTVLTRRDFLRFSGIGLGAYAVASCGVLPAAPADQPRALVGDVTDYALKGDWLGRFGFVKFKLHAAFANGERAYFIRTDSSDQAFAEANKLVFAPLLNAAERAKSGVSNLYLFDGGAPNQLPIINTIPNQPNYSPLFRVHRVKPKGTTLYDSEAKLLAAAQSGDLSIERQRIFVNYPVVKWSGGELSVDAEKKEYLGGGQLLAPVDTTNMTVIFKLHECFPGSRYIVSDTSAAPMAPMMKVAASAPLQALADVKATDKIWVFANGLKGSGVMGFQPAIFAHQAGNPNWSPFWNHFTLKWKEEAKARVLKSEEDVNAASSAGEVDLFNGTPDTHPVGFLVNCPVPVLAPNTFGV